MILFNNLNTKNRIMFPKVATIIIAFFILLIGSCGRSVSTTEHYDNDNSKIMPEYVQGEVLVKLKSELNSQKKELFMARNRIAKFHPIISDSYSDIKENTNNEMKKWYKGILEENVNVEDVMLTLQIDPDIDIYESNNYVFLTDVNPNDPGHSDQWGIQKIQAPGAWEYTTGKSDIVVAVIDSGIDRYHEDLTNNMWVNEDEIPGNGVDDDNNGYIDDYHGWDFLSNNNNPGPANAHGTVCAGILGAMANNSKGGTGVAWNVKIMALRFTVQDHYGTMLGVANAIRYAADNGAKISSNSYRLFGTYGYLIYDAIAYAKTKGHLYVVAANNISKNNDTSSDSYPCAYDLDNILCVAATDQSDNKTSWSSYGKTTVDLAAPGIDIYTTWPGNSYGWGWGTSMSTPFVAGTAALIKSYSPDITYSEIKEIIMSTVDKKPQHSGLWVSEGRLNVRKALQATKDPLDSPTNVVAEAKQDSSITVSWDSILTDENATYKLIYGTISGEYTNTLDVQKETTAIISNLVHNQDYYLAVKAFSLDFPQSAPSLEVFATAFDAITPLPVVDLTNTLIERSQIELSVSDSSGEYSFELSASNLIDNNLNTHWAAPVSEYATTHFIIFNMESSTIIDSVKLYPSNNYIEFFPRDFEILTSLDGENWSVIVKEQNFIATGSDGEQWMFAPTEAKYIKVFISKSYYHENGLFYAVLSEFNVFGQMESSSINLTWTGSGDDENIGTPFIYDIRYLEGSTLTENDYNLISYNKKEQTPTGPAGTLEQSVISGLKGETSYVFALKVLDEANNISSMSNMAKLTTPGIAPSAISDLRVTAKNNNSIGLSWTAPGDDGSNGTASLYDIRYSNEEILPGNFNNAFKFMQAPLPENSGEAQSVIITDLTHHTSYYFAIKSADESNNISGLSNIAFGITSEEGDIIPPGHIVDLNAKLSSSIGGTISIDDVRNSGIYSTDFAGENIVDGNSDTAWASPTSESIKTEWIELDFGSLKTIGRVSAECSHLFPTLFPRDFSWQVSTNRTSWQTIAEESDFESEGGINYEWNFAAVETRFIRMYITETAENLGYYHAVISEIAVYEAFILLNRVELSWFAPGDDNFTGTAFEYDIRYADFQFNNSNFEVATRLNYEYPPSLPGSLESLIVPDLPGETTYYFGIKTKDEANNVSTVSNIVSVNTPDIPPDTIKDLYVALNEGNSITLTWTATGDDANTGTASYYDLRYSTEQISSDNFNNANPIYGLNSPKQAGTTEEFKVLGLTSNVTYYFAIKAIDEKGNVSQLGSVLSVKAKDIIPPNSVTDLSISACSPELGLKLPTKIANYSDENNGYSAANTVDNNENTAWRLTSEGYCNAYLTIDLKKNFPVSMIRMKPEVDEYKNWFPKTFKLELSTNGSQWSTVVIENNYTVSNNNWVDWMFNETNARYARLQVSDCYNPSYTNDYHISVAEIEIFIIPQANNAVVIDWHSTGDNGTEGIASTYELRYSTEPLTENNFNNADLVLGLNSPLASGMLEQTVVTNLENNTTYHFGLIVIDDENNRSYLSNVENTAIPVAPPARIFDLSVSESSYYDLEITWTAPGAILLEGQASSYEVRFSTSKITSTSWESATPARTQPVPQTAGSSETFLIEGLLHSTLYYIAIKTTNGNGNISHISNVTNSTTLLPPETIKPANITDISAETWQSSDGYIELTWTAPGDDGMTGKALEYDLRYSKNPILEDNFYSSTKVAAISKPKSAGTSEQLVVTFLEDETKYYFAIKTIDDVNNTSGISNITFAQTREVPPSQIRDITVSLEELNSTTITWTAPGDNNNEGQASTYEIKYYNTYINESNWQLATSVQNVPSPKPAGETEILKIEGLIEDTNYFIAIKARDLRNNESLISLNANSNTVDNKPPAIIGDLASVKFTVRGMIKLTWTAVGDNGNTKRANNYDLRFSTSTITEQNFEAASQATGLPNPSEPLTQETFYLSGLEDETIYYFAIKAVDEKDNKPGISNISSAMTMGVPPAKISNLNADYPTLTSIRLTWMATGENGYTGTATSYDIRYSQEIITEQNFYQATEVFDTLEPKPSGENEEFTVIDLIKNTIYYFAIKAVDDIGNVSNIAIVNLSTIDPDPPADITDLVAETASYTKAIKITWTAPGDNEFSGRAKEYDIRYSKQHITDENFEQANKSSYEPIPINGGTTQNFNITGLEIEEKYYIAIKTVDESDNWSKISNVSSAFTKQELPATISDLKAQNPTLTSIELHWTATGDDQKVGTASSYDIRYAKTSSELADWDNATTIEDIAAPQISGSLEHLTIHNLLANTVYYFAIKAIDDRDNISPISNILETSTIDNETPGKIVDLNVTTFPSEQGSVYLSWTAVGDDGTKPGAAAEYEVRYSENEITENNFEQGNTVSNPVPNPSQAGEEDHMTITGLQPESLLYFAIRVIDESENVGLVSNSASGRTNDKDPAAVTNLSVLDRTETSIVLTFTAPGDDGNTGTASSYEIRYSKNLVNDSNYDSALIYTAIETPKEAGSVEQIQVPNLETDVKYYFALKAIDDRDNISFISNIISGKTLDIIAPGDINSLRAVAPPSAGEKVSTNVVDSSGSYSDDFSAANCVDKKTLTDWVSPQRDELQSEYIVLSTEEQFNIESISLFPSRDFSSMFPQNFEIQLSKNRVQWETALSINDYSADPGTWHKFEFTAIEAKYIRLYISEDNRSEESEYIIIAEIEVYAAPSRTDLINLKWIAPGDNGMSGTISQYDIRYSTSPLSADNFNLAELVNNEPTPSTSGILESMTIEGLNAETLYYFALKSIDEDENVSNLSNITNAMTLGIPPAQITDLNNISSSESSITIAFTAPGDNGNNGRASSYDLRYSTEPITEGNWSSTTQIENEPAPSDAGSEEQIEVLELASGTRYYFAVKTTDDINKVSVLSSEFSAYTLQGADNTLPGTINTLDVTTISQGGGKLLNALAIDSSGSQFPDYTMSNITDKNEQTEWSTPPREELQDEYIVLDLNSIYTISTIMILPSFGYPEFFPVDFEILISTNTQIWTKVAEEANYNIPASEVENWQSWHFTPISARYVKIFISKSNSLDSKLYFTMLAEIAIHEAELDSGSVVLSWIAKGDDGESGIVQYYDIRYSQSMLYDYNFDNAERILNPPTPLSSGSIQSFIITDLEPEIEYFFALKSVDEAGNFSTISNVVSTNGLNCDINYYEVVEQSCDGIDNDCDGDTDENLTAPGNCKNQGVCTGTVDKCNGAQGWICEYPDNYWEEEWVCDGKDNDCDGDTDEDDVCNGEGCIPTLEICDGEDNDCDHHTDEDLTPPGYCLKQGVCTDADEVCEGVIGWVCNYPYNYEETENSCDELDNDCDGLTDENCPE